MGYSNREFCLIWRLWLSLPGFDGLFEQRNLLDMVLVVVPFARGHESRLWNAPWGQFHGSLILSHFHAA